MVRAVNFIKKYFLPALFIIVILYCIFKLFNFKLSLMKTDTALDTVYCDLVETIGLAAKNETIIKNYTDTKISYKLKNGDKIGKGAVIAEVYEKGLDKVYTRKLYDIETELDSLQKLSNMAKYDITNPDILEEKISSGITSIVSQNRSYPTLTGQKERLNKLICMKKVALGKKDNIEDRIKFLKTEQEKICGQISNVKDSIYATDDGYFLNFLDGYETLIPFDINKLKNIENIDALQNCACDLEDFSVGKLINSSEWYIICPISKDQADRMEIGAECQIKLMGSYVPYIPCKIKSMNFTDKDCAIVILHCSHMDEGICRFRKGPLKIKIHDYSGIKVKKSALRHKDPQMLNSHVKFDDLEVGVNIKCGDITLFKKVNIIYSDDLYVICSSEGEYAKNPIYLRPGDQVIL